MTRDPRPPVPASLDDDSIGMLVRDVVDGWAMPAVRLDAPGWRERVRGRRGRLIDATRSGLGRVVQALTAAIALTVVAALVAIIVTRPPQQPAGSPPPTVGPTTDPTAAAATPLPRLLLNGEVPFPTSVLVANDGGDIALVDLASGTISGSIARTQWPSSLTVTATGVVACICISASEPVDGYPTRLDIRLRTFARTTTPIRDDAVTVLEGTPDPRLPPTSADHVWTSIWFSPDDRYALVGWSTRAGLVWHSGVLAVDIRAGTVTGEQAFPDMTAGDGDARRTVGAPRVLGIAADGTVFLARSWAEWGSANVDTEPARVGDDAFTDHLADGALAGLVAFPTGARCGPSYLRAGARPGGGLWVTCVTEAGALTIRRAAADGTDLGSELLGAVGTVDGDTTAVSPDGKTFFAWDPGGWTLTKVDLASGERVDRRLDGSTAAADPMAAFGRWLAPAAEAKTVLRGAVLPSPDGTRLYVLAANPVEDAREPTGSAGILVVDADTLDVIDRWPPTADLMSMALSLDGTLLYAAGLPGVDAAGSRSLRQGASVTVYDTATGAVRLVAGQLGMDMLSFPRPFVP